MEMNNHDFNEFIKGVYGMFPMAKPLSDMTLMLMYEKLKDEDFESLKRAIMAFVDNSKFPPTIADIKASLHGSEEDRSLYALKVVRNAMKRCGSHRSVQFQDAKIHYAIELMGGWYQLWQHDDKFLDRDFLERYRSAQRVGAGWQHVPKVLEVSTYGQIGELIKVDRRGNEVVEKDVKAIGVGGSLVDSRD